MYSIYIYYECTLTYNSHITMYIHIGKLVYIYTYRKTRAGKSKWITRKPVYITYKDIHITLYSNTGWHICVCVCVCMCVWGIRTRYILYNYTVYNVHCILKTNYPHYLFDSINWTIIHMYTAKCKSSKLNATSSSV